MTAGEDRVDVDPAVVEVLRHARAQVATWQDIADTARAQLEAQLGGHDTGVVDGQVAGRWAHVKTSRLDGTLVKALHPEVYADCQTVSTSRRFTLVDPS